MAWCSDNDVDYVIGLARNSRLAERIEWVLDDAAAEAERKGRPARFAKAEHLADKANPRFVVTSLPADTFSARPTTFKEDWISSPSRSPSFR